MTTSETTEEAPQEAPRGTASQGKREAVLDAAVELFLAGGFDGTSMDAVAARAGVAKTTVYAHYGDKVELFQAATARGGASVDLDLDKVMLAAVDDPEERLTQIVFKVLEATTAPQSLAFLRVMVTEAVRRPELTKVVRSLGVPHIIELVARTLREDAHRHEYFLPDPEAYAWLFIRMASAALQVDALVDAGRSRDTTFLQAQAEWVTSIFLRALRNRDAGNLPDVPAAARTEPSPHCEPTDGKTVADAIRRRLPTGPTPAPAPPAPAPAPAPTVDIVSLLKQFAELRDSGILTEEEFQTQKARLLV